MTVSSTTTRNSYSGDGSTTAFAYGFKIFASSDLTVILRSATGVETVQTETTHYTVSNVGVASGGNVTFGSAPASGVTVVIRRNSPLTQLTDYTPNDPFPADDHENALDKLTFIAQQQQEELDRSIKLSRTNTMTSTEFTTSATDRASKILAFDTSGELSVTQELGTFRGDFAASTAYNIRDLVKDTSTGNVFFVNEAHTSSGSEPLTSNANASKYSLILDATQGVTAGTVSASKVTVVDSSKDLTGLRNLTITGELDAATLDISGNVDVDGTLETDALTIDGVTLAETISDTVGAMVSSNTETGISVSYEDSDNTLDFALGSSQTTISSLLNTSLVIGRDSDNDIDFATDNTILFRADGADQIKLTNGALVPVTDDDVDLGSSSLQFKDGFFDGTLEADAITVGGTAVLTGGAETAITSVLNTSLVVGRDADNDIDFATDNEITFRAGAEDQVVLKDGVLEPVTDDNIDLGSSSKQFKDVFIDGTLEADAITLNGTALGSTFQVLAGSSDTVTTGALNSGSITTGFGNIDNGTSNITSGGLVKLDVDSDADDITGDSSTGRLTLGAGEDLNLYHGGTNSYIVNDTGNLVVDTGTSDADIVFSGNDGGSAITALTIDMSDAGKLLPNNGIDLNGKELILDADADTSITSDTDDQIDIRIAGADDFQFTANTFTIAAGSTIVNNGTMSPDISSTGKAAVFGF